MLKWISNQLNNMKKEVSRLAKKHIWKKISTRFLLGHPRSRLTLQVDRFLPATCRPGFQKKQVWPTLLSSVEVGSPIAGYCCSRTQQLWSNAAIRLKFIGSSSTARSNDNGSCYPSRLGNFGFCFSAGPPLLIILPKIILYYNIYELFLKGFYC